MNPNFFWVWLVLFVLYLSHSSRSLTPPVITLTGFGPQNVISGTNYLFCPKTATVTMKCEANYPIRWATTLGVLRYDLPIRIATNQNISVWEFSQNLTYVSLLVVRFNGVTPQSGFVSCAAVGENVSSNLIIGGEESHRRHEGQIPWWFHCLRFRIKDGWEKCPTDKFGLFYYNKSNYDPNRGGLCDSWSKTNADMKIVRSAYFRPITLESLNKTNLEVHRKYKKCAKRFPLPPLGTESRKEYCKQYNCTHPFDCNMKKINGHFDCSFENSGKSNCLNKFSSSLLSCPGLFQEYYNFKTSNSSLSWCRDLQKLQLLQLEKISDRNGTFVYTCLGVSFVLGGQLIFSIKFNNGSEKLLSKFIEYDNSTQLVDGIWNNTLEFRPEPDVKEIVCRAPRFDSELWLNVSQLIWPSNVTDKGITEATSTDKIKPKRPGNEDKNYFTKSSTTFTTGIPTNDSDSKSNKSSVEDKATSFNAGNDRFTTQTQLTEWTSKPPDKKGLLYPEESEGSKNSSDNEEGERKLNEADDSKGDKNSFRIIVIAVVAVVIIIIVLVTLSIICGIRRYRSKHLHRQLTSFEMREFMDGTSRVSMQKITDSATPMALPFEMEIPESELMMDLDNLIEKNGFLSTYPGSVNGRSAVVKTTYPTTTVNFFLNFLKDIKIMQRVDQQPNIVAILGAVTTNMKDRVIYVAFESSMLGNVKDFLRRSLSSVEDSVEMLRPLNCDPDEENQDIPLDCHRLLNWCEQIAAGMAFLQRENLVHGDLSASNMLLFPKNLIKISELSPYRQDFYREQYLRSYKPPAKWRWMAIELLRSKNFTIKSDVWAFGVTMWEILSLGEDPHPGIKWTPGFVLQLENGYRMEMPIVANNDVYQILLRCWYRYPNDRLNFAKIQESIQECRDKATNIIIK